MNNTFSFEDALGYIKADMPVSLTINGTERVYRLNGNGEIICIPNNKHHLTYKVKEFHIDAIMSYDWKLVD